MVWRRKHYPLIVYCKKYAKRMAHGASMPQRADNKSPFPRCADNMSVPRGKEKIVNKKEERYSFFLAITRVT